jgi:tetraacyldisaccharide 4'-kinase
MREIELWWRRAVDADALKPLGFLEPFLSVAYHMWRNRADRPVNSRLPVVSIGSPLIGGSGKTPLTHWVAQKLSEQARVAIVGRGYRRSSCGHQLVSDGQGTLADMQAAGDELTMLAHRIPQALVIANANRLQAIARAQELGAQVVCLDDALQNQSVKKNLNLVVLHRDEGPQQPRLFPLGRLRLPFSAIQGVDALVMICPSGTSKEEMNRVLRPTWMPLQPPLAVARMRHAGFWDALEHSPAHLESGQRVAAWASIASPGRFFASLIHEGLILTGTRAEPDHQTPEPRGLQQWAFEQRARGARYLCCTEKDAMHPLPSLCLPVVYLRIELEFPLGDELLTGLLKERVHDGIACSQSR